MHRSVKERVGHIKQTVAGTFVQQKQSILAGSMVGVMLISLCLPLGAIHADSMNDEGRHRSHNQTDHSRSVSNDEVADTLADIPGVMESADQTVVSSDDDSAINAATADATIDVPKDANDGITMDSGDGTPVINIELPNADQAQVAKTIAAGTVAYEGNDGSANAVQAMEDGGVRMLTVIDNHDAPTEYDYKITVPSGGHIEVLVEGGAVVNDAEGTLVAVVATPWARDAGDKEVSTWFTTDGTTLTQHVEHNMSGVVYPVSADPSIKIGWGSKCLMTFMGGCAYSMSYPNSATISLSANDVNDAKQTGNWANAMVVLACGLLKKASCASIGGFAAFVIPQVPAGRGVAIRFGEGGQALSWWLL